MKRTPLYEAHQKLGAKLIEFGGWEMPVYYTSIMDEHQAVRTGAGLFDISHMGELIFKGPAAADFLNGVLTNDLGKLTPGLGQYTLMCNEKGGVVDDLYAYRIDSAEFLLIVNAARIDADVAWLESQLAAFPRRGDVEFKNASDDFGAVAVQGPKVVAFVDSCFSSGGQKPTSLRKNEVARFNAAGQSVLVSRTGYTGEDGFEVVAPALIIGKIWADLLAAGQSVGIKPAGLGARDTLRTESCYPLYGHELDETTTPLEAGLGFFVAMDKDRFTGSDALLHQKVAGLPKKLVAFKMTDRCAPPRPDYPVWCARTESKRIGKVTSGTQSPTLGTGIGLAYVTPEFATPSTPIAIEIRGKRTAAIVVPKPFYRRS